MLLDALLLPWKRVRGGEVPFVSLVLFVFLALAFCYKLFAFKFLDDVFGLLFFFGFLFLIFILSFLLLSIIC